MKLFGSPKKLIDKTKMEKMHVVLKWLKQTEDSSTQQTININKSLMYYILLCLINPIYGYLLNVEQSNVVFLKIYNTELDDTTVIFTD